MLIAEAINSHYYIKQCDDRQIVVFDNKEKQEQILEHAFMLQLDSINHLDCTDFAQLTFAQLPDFKDIDILLIGTGQQQAFPQDEQFFQDKLPFSIDFMPSAAACRIYNLLASEERKVAALIFF